MKVRQAKIAELKEHWNLRAHAPLRLECLSRVCLSEDLVARQAADTASSVVESHGVLGRQTAAVTDYAARIAHDVRVLEPTRGSEVESSECTRLTQKVTVTAVSVIRY